MSRPATSTRLRALSLGEANHLLVALDPAQGPVRSHKFAIALEDDDGVVRGVAIAGPPTDQLLSTSCRLEVIRVATDGTPNAAVALYRTAARAGVAIGYRPSDIHTYTYTYTSTGHLAAALRSAGWVPITAHPGSSRRHPGHRNHLAGTQTRWHAASPTVTGRAS